MSEGGTRGKQIAAADVMLAPLPMAFGNGLGRPPCRSGSAADAIRQGDHDKVTQGLPMVYHHLDLAVTDTARDVRVALTAWHRQATDRAESTLEYPADGLQETIVAIHADDAVDLQVAFIPGSGRATVSRRHARYRPTASVAPTRIVETNERCSGHGCFEPAAA